MEGFSRKKIIKGVGIGMAVAGSLLMPKESISQNDTKPEDTKNKTEVVDKNKNAEEYRNTYLRYMNHPSYKKRLAKEMFGDAYDEKYNGEAVNEEYDKRLNKLKNVEIKNIQKGDENFGRSKPYAHIIESEESALYHELTHEIDNNNYGQNPNGFTKIKEKIASSYPDSIKNFYNSDIVKLGHESIYNQKLELYNDFINDKIKFDEYLPSYRKFDDKKAFMLKMLNDPKQNLNSMIVYISSYGKDINGKDINRDEYLSKYENTKDSENIKNMLNAFSKFRDDNYENDYFNQDTEVKARINSLRLNAIKKYKYDQSKSFNINDYPELKKERAYKDLIEKIKLTDEQINELSKYVADSGISNNRGENIA